MSSLKMSGPVLNATQDFIPVVDSVAKKVIHIDFPADYTKSSASDKTFKTQALDVKLSAASTTPPALSADALAAANRERIPPPIIRHDFLPDLIQENLAKEGKKYQVREDLKPMHVLQPEGVSFKVNGHEVEWQKWKFHVCE